MSNALRVHHGLFGRVAVLEMSRSLVVHAHAQAHVLIKIGGVDSSFSVREGRVQLTDTDAVLVNSWEPHAYHHPPSRERTLVLALYLDPIWLTATGLGWGPTSRFRSNAQRIEGSLRDTIARLTTSLILASDGLEHVDDAVLEVLGHVRAVDASATATAVDRRVARCLDYMREHLDEREDLEALGSRFGLSRPHLFYMFQRTFAVTPNVYWNALRMEYAILALREGKHPIGAIARDIGFNSQSNFTRFFQGIQGVAPSDYQSAVSDPVLLRA